MNIVDEQFFKLEFLNGKDITKEQLDDALVENNYILIDLYNAHWSPNIYIPDNVPFKGGIIYIKSRATYKSTVHVYNREYIVSTGGELVVSGSSGRQWVAVVPAP